MPEGYYQKYDNYDAININKTKEIPIDYEGWMGVPITALDKPEIMECMEIKGFIRPYIQGKSIYFRTIVRWLWPKLLNAYQTGEPVEVEGIYHSAELWGREQGITFKIK